MKILDTNVIIRFFINDDSEMNRYASDLIENETVFVTPEVIAEFIYILTKYYEIDREHSKEKIIDLIALDNVNAEHSQVIGKSLELFAQTSLDYVDCLLCAYHTEYGYEVCTFDKKLKS